MNSCIKRAHNRDFQLNANCSHGKICKMSNNFMFLYICKLIPRFQFRFQMRIPKSLVSTHRARVFTAEIKKINCTQPLWSSNTSGKWYRFRWSADNRWLRPMKKHDNSPLIFFYHRHVSPKPKVNTFGNMNEKEKIQTKLTIRCWIHSWCEYISSPPRSGVTCDRSTCANKSSNDEQIIRRNLKSSLKNFELTSDMAFWKKPAGRMT